MRVPKLTTIHAVFLVSQIDTPTSGVAANTYVVGGSYSATDGSLDSAGSFLAFVPYFLSTKKANDFLRKAVSDKIFADLGWVIDPDDIYFPTA